ncbi:substrate-binding domain-containing protein [Nisaea nitritireducens]|uniref:substrate-binding domain-containing protein n=1 Tax=Nisaea nitritireducens TaxID=568392 RepID=UPI001865C319|nr:substrate-binding domain-containing protein [Nisaea nitritireducens]
MRKLLKVLVLAAAIIPGTFGPATVSAQGDPRFIELDAFFSANPDELGKSETFARWIQEAARPLKIPVKTPVTIHIIYPGLQQSDYWRRSVKSFTARMDEIGIPHKVTSLFTKSAEDLRLQEQAIGEVLRQKPDFLIFTLDALRHKGMISRVLASRDTKVILQNITTPLTDLGPPSPLLYVGFDHGVGSRMLADAHIARAGKKARYAIFYGPVGYVSKMRGGTFKRRISALTDYQLVAEYYVGFDRAQARRAALDLFRIEKDLSFVFAASTDIAHGITDALDELGLLGTVKVNGWGGGSSELTAIRNHEIDFTVMRMNDDNGIAMAEAIRMTLEDEIQEIPQVFSGAFSMVDQTTSDETLETLVDQAFRYSR